MDTCCFLLYSKQMTDRAVYMGTCVTVLSLLLFMMPTRMTRRRLRQGSLIRWLARALDFFNFRVLTIRAYFDPPVFCIS